MIQKQKGIFTADDFRKEYGIDPAQWASVKSIAGCTSDEVPGIRGVGESTAIKFLTNKLLPKAKTYQNITCREGQGIVARNRPLVTLPFKGCPEISLFKGENLSLTGFCDMCAENNFAYFLKKEVLTQWKNLLNLH